MPKPDEDGPRPEPAPVRPPTLPPDFPDIPQNPSSELQPASDPSASPDKVASSAPAPAEPERLRRKNARLRDKIDQVLEKHPELRDVAEGIALRQDLHVQVGTPFLERVQSKLQERARAIIERRPDLEHLFNE
jgi:hypothetical protein